MNEVFVINNKGVLLRYIGDSPDICIPSSVKQIGENAFSDNKSIRNLKFSFGTTVIGRGAFSHCFELESISLPNSLRHIDDYAFWNCRNLQEITIPFSVKSVGRGAFRECKALQSVVVRDGVKHIEACAFEDCINLVKAVIPDSVKIAGDNIFYGCKFLRNIDASDEWKQNNMHVLPDTDAYMLWPDDSLGSIGVIYGNIDAKTRFFDDKFMEDMKKFAEDNPELPF